MKDTFNFIGSIVNSLAWPITVIIMGLILKKPFQELLNRVGKLKIKDIEADFSNEINNVKEEAKSANLFSGDAIQSKNNKMVKGLYEDVEEIARISPQAAISLAWIRVDSVIMDLVVKSNISPDYPFYNSALKNINILKEYYDLDPKTINVLESLRRLRNEVLHVHPSKSIQVTYNDALDYGRLAEGIINKIELLR